MSDLAYGTFLAWVAVGSAVPLVVAHYGRRPRDRLPWPWVVPVVGLCLAVAWASVRPLYSPPGLTPAGAALSLAFGVGVGAVGLIAYAVLERLVRPALAGLDTPVRDR